MVDTKQRVEFTVYTRDESRRSVMATVARCAKDRITVAADALACYPKIIKAAMPQADIKQIH